MESIQMLRRYVKDCTDHETLLTSNPPKHRVVATAEQLEALIDGIEKEVMEHYTSLPKDLSGNIIGCGTYVKVEPYDGQKVRVHALQRSEYCWEVILADGTKEPVHRVRLYKPESVEEMLYDLIDEYRFNDNGLSMGEIIDMYAEKLKLREDD